MNKNSMVNPRPAGNYKCRLFCIPFAGRGATVFHGWDKMFPREVDVCPIYLPGREHRIGEPSFQRIEPLVDELVKSVRPLLDVPFVFLGHSLGALVAYCVTRRLAEEGQVAQRLIVSAQVAPHQLNGGRQLHLLPDELFISELQRYYGGIPEKLRLDPQLRSLFIPILRADLAIIETYVHRSGPPLDIPISGFRGLHDQQIPEAGFAAWREMTSLEFTSREIDGSHFFLVENKDQVMPHIIADVSSPYM